MRTVAIIQARMGSTRLPGKVLRDLMGKTVLEHVVDRVRRVATIDEVVIATTVQPADDELVHVAESYGVTCYRGSESDVLSRYVEAARVVKADTVIRITSDCPLIEPQVLSQLIELFVQSGADYASNTLDRSYPRGLDAEIFTFKALEQVDKVAKLDYEREHVTPYFYQHPELFKLASLKHDQDLSAHRWTLDTVEDWELIYKLYERLYCSESLFSLADVLRVFDEHPDWMAINAHVEQKKLTTTEQP